MFDGDGHVRTHRSRRRADGLKRNGCQHVNLFMFARMSGRIMVYEIGERMTT